VTKKKIKNQKSKPNEYDLIIPSKLEKLVQVEKYTEKIAAIASLSKDQGDNLAIAVTEAVGNAIVHGNMRDPEKKVIIHFTITQKQVTAEVKDQGSGFDPKSLSNPLKPENIMKENGRGIFILKSLMDKVSFHFSPKGTVIRMILKIRK
jgi:serine/threonine-protein kinase RsbW